MLAGCGGEPSEGQIKETIEKQVQRESAAAGAFSDMLPKVSVSKKIGCKGDGDNAYKCDVELLVTQGKSQNTGVKQFRFVKASDGWALSQ